VLYDSLEELTLEGGGICGFVVQLSTRNPQQIELMEFWLKPAWEMIDKWRQTQTYCKTYC